MLIHALRHCGKVDKLIIRAFVEFRDSHMRYRPPVSFEPRKYPQQSRSKITMEVIFDATVQVLLAEGIPRLTTTRVAQRAGFSIGTLYQYFPHKQALIYALIGKYLNEVVEKVEKTCEINYGQPLVIAIDQLIESYVDAKTTNPDISHILYRVSSEIDVTPLVEGVSTRLLNAIIKLLASVPDVCFDNIKDVAFAIMSTLTGTIRIVFEQDVTTESIQKHRHHLKTMCISFLREVTQ